MIVAIGNLFPLLSNCSSGPVACLRILKETGFKEMGGSIHRSHLFVPSRQFLEWQLRGEVGKTKMFNEKLLCSFILRNHQLSFSHFSYQSVFCIFLSHKVLLVQRVPSSDHLGCHLGGLPWRQEASVARAQLLALLRDGSEEVGAQPLGAMSSS